MNTKAQILDQMESVNMRLKALEALYELAIKSGGSQSRIAGLETRIDKLNEKFCELMLQSEKAV